MSELGCTKCDVPTIRPGLCNVCIAAEEMCAEIGHEWEPMGGGMEICGVCLEERDAPNG